MEKIKQFIESETGKDILVILIVILVGLGSFELGRLSKENDSGGVKIEYPNQNNNLAQPDSSTQTSLKTSNVVATSKGSKYYSISCSAGKTIKEENKIWFTTGEEAEKAGYELSSACQ